MRMLRDKNIALLLICFMTLSIVAGCYRGRPSSRTPVHINPNMDNQPKYDAQEASNFFENGSAMRLPVEGTIARGELREDIVYFTGKNESGKFVKTSPVPVTIDLLKHGQERFNIFCSPCHSRAGDGQGIVVKRGYQPPPTFHADRLRDIEDGYIFDVMTNGIRNMPSYRHQVPVADRWAIVAFFRALQRSQNATINDIPSDKRDAVR